jgi:NAD(P)-dependent dehydrogenase (short-subunit alcohol dehydrogenase family)
MKKVWFITGASKGLGLVLVQKLLSKGYNVAATSRNKEALAKAVGNYDAAKFLPLEVDLTNETSVKKSVEEAHQYFRRLDVLVNNAGYGIGGAVEELSSAEIHASFDVNVFATIFTMQAAMPYFRKQRSGHIINISSIAGFAAASGWAMYATTKFAVTGLTEVMAEDVKEFGVKATVVLPGAFRTEFLSDNSLMFGANQIEDYKGIRASHAKYASMNGNQLGDPAKAAEVFIELAEMEAPPVRLFLGSDAYSRAGAKIELMQQDLEVNKEMSFKTDFK